MTVQAVATPVSQVGNGVTTQINIPWAFFLASDLRVTMVDTTTGTPVESTLTLNGTPGYTVTGGLSPTTGLSSNGYITLSWAFTALQTITVTPDLPITQLTHFVPNGPLPAASLENTLDKLTILAQQLNGFPPPWVPAPQNGTFLGWANGVLTNVAGGLSSILDSAFVNYIPAWAGAVIRTLKAKMQDEVSVLDFGADPTGATDSTAAFNAAIAALPSGGGVVKVPSNSGFYSLNLVILRPGITLRCGGTASGVAVPTSNYLQHFDPTKPVIAMGDGATDVSGSCIEDACFYLGNTGQVGLSYRGGTFRNWLKNVQVLNFTKRGIEYDASLFSSLMPIFANKGAGITINSGVAGAIGVYLSEGTGTLNQSYCNGMVYSGFDIQCANGYNVWVNGAEITLLGGYLEQSYSGLGLMGTNTGAGVHSNSVIYLNRVSIDNAAGPSAVVAIIDNATDYEGAAPFSSLFLQGEYIATGPLFVVAATSTGSMALNGYALTLASATQARAGRWVIVAGAGNAAGTIPLVARINLVSGTTATLSLPCLNTGGVAGVVAQVGSLMADPAFFIVGGSGLSGSELMLANSKRSGIPSASSQGLLMSTSANGVGPFAGYGNKVWLLGQGEHHILQNDDVTMPSITSIVLNGAVATVTFGSTHNIYTGGLILVQGCNEDCNGTAIATRVDATHITYPCTAPATTATAGAGTSISIEAHVDNYFHCGGLVLAPNGLQMKNWLGVVSNVLQQNISCSQFNIFTPDASNGVMIFNAAQTANANPVFYWVGGGGIKASMNTYGNMTLGGTAGTDANPGLVINKRAAGTPATNAAFGSIYVDSTGSLRYVSPAGTSTQIAPA